METTTFPVFTCDACARDVLGAWVLGDDDALALGCARCGAVQAEVEVRQASAVELGELGYDVPGATDSAGCGTGGGCGGSCGVPR